MYPSAASTHMLALKARSPLTHQNRERKTWLAAPRRIMLCHLLIAAVMAALANERRELFLRILHPELAEREVLFLNLRRKETAAVIAACGNSRIFGTPILPGLPRERATSRNQHRCRRLTRAVESCRARM